MLFASFPEEYVGLKLYHLRKFAYQLLVVLEHLKELDIIHGDIKPHNLSFNYKTGWLVVFDLGHAILPGSNRRSKSVQSPYYRAPEIYLGREYDHSIDMWSAGCVLFEAYIGKAPFPSRSDREHMEMVVSKRGMPSFSYIQNSPDAVLFFKYTFSPLHLPKNLTEISLQPSENKSEKADAKEKYKVPTFTQGSFISMKQQVVNKAKLSKEPLQEAKALWQLIDHMLCYENRISPTQALSSEFFQHDLLFELYFDPIFRQMQGPVHFLLFHPENHDAIS